MNLKRAAVGACVAIVAMALLGGVYSFGAYSYALGKWPATSFRWLKVAALKSQRNLGVDYDAYGRLIAYPKKFPIECPRQTERTAVFLIIGQSNAANQAGQRFQSQSGDKTANYINGSCTRPASPLLGSTATAGEAWTPLADRLVRDGTFDQVVLVPAAISATKLSEWVSGSPLNTMLRDSVADVQRRYRVTHVLWHQGESDLSSHTSEDKYLGQFRSLVHDLRVWGIDAPIYVSVTTRCYEFDANWAADNPISQAQRKLPDPALKIVAGVDSDKFLDDADRYDGCHMAESGLAKFVEAWAGVLGAK